MVRAGHSANSRVGTALRAFAHQTAAQDRTARREVTPAVFASEAKQSRAAIVALDRFVAHAPSDDGVISPARSPRPRRRAPRAGACLPVGTAVTASQSKTMTGWTLGAGLEYALTERWTVRGEYRYSD